MSNVTRPKGAVELCARFEADNGEKLREELGRQTIFQSDPTALNRIILAGKVQGFAPDDVLIKQGEPDTDIQFIIAGEVVIEVSGTEVNRRRAGTHVGEMAMIDPTARRSATVRATTDTVVLRVSEVDFVAIADRHPAVWRRLARDIAQRLRERDRFVRPKNPRAEVFIGSSTERLDIARELQTALERDAVVTIWTDDVFQPAHPTIDDLLVAAKRTDFAVLLVSPDDITRSRKIQQAAPRDNVVLELGIFLGELGRERTLVVKPREAVKIPSDYLGLKAIEYSNGEPSTLAARVGSVAHAIRKVVASLGPR